MTAVLLTILFIILSAVGWVALAVLLTIGMTRRLTGTTDIASATSVSLRPRSSEKFDIDDMIDAINEHRRRAGRRRHRRGTRRRAVAHHLGRPRVTACFRRLRLAVWSTVPMKVTDGLGNSAAYRAATLDVTPDRAVGRAEHMPTSACRCFRPPSCYSPQPTT